MADSDDKRLADSDDKRLAESAETPETPETTRWRTIKAAIGAFLHRRSRSVEEVERMIDELRELNQLHGDIGQRVMGDYEGVLWAMWYNRSANVAIVTGLLLLGAAFLHSPQWLMFGIIGVGFSIAGILFLVSIGHWTEMREYRRGNIIVDEDPTPGPTTTTRKRPKSGRRTRPDGHSMRRRRRLHP